MGVGFKSLKKKAAVNRELRLIQSTLNVGLRRDVSGTITGKSLARKGFLTSKGRTSAKGKRALNILKQLRK